MPLTPAFTIANNIVNTNTFVLTDTSTGTDGTVTKIVVFVYDVANNQIAGSPFTFAYTLNAAYNLSVLTQDMSANVVVQWQTVANAVQATSAQIFAFTGYSEWSIYGLIQQVAANNSLLRDKNFYDNLSYTITDIDSANKSITTGSSIFNAEAMILLAQYKLNNQNLFF